MKVWITKYCLTKGIFEFEAERCGEYGERLYDMVHDISGGSQSIYYHGEGKDWHITRESAISRAESMRIKKIASLKKSIMELEAMVF